MTVPQQPTRTTHVGNGVTTAFAYDFLCLAARDLQVIVAGAVIDPSTYTVSNVGQSSGGDVTFLSPPADQAQIVIQLDMVLDRETDYQTNGDLFAKTVNFDFDRLWLAIQQAFGFLTRVPRLGDSDIDGAGAYRARNNRIQDLGAPVAMNDAARKQDIVEALAELSADGTGQFVVERLADTTSDANGAGMVGYIQSGPGAVARDMLEKSRETISLRDFYIAVELDQAGAFNRLAANARTRIAPKIVISGGRWNAASPVILDVPDNTTIEWIGELVSSVVSSPAVRLGSMTRNVIGINARGFNITNPVVNPSDGTTGLWLANLSASNLQVDRVMGFQTGVLCYGSQANGGMSYCSVELGLLHDNRTNLRLTATGVGYCNENTFYGGSFNHSSNYPAGVQTVNIMVDYYATHKLNNNRFMFPSFEDNKVEAVAAVINGTNTLIFHPRLENPANQENYKILLGPNSYECEIVGNSFTIQPTNIQDEGFANSYSTRMGDTLRRQSSTALGVLNLQGVASNANLLLRGTDISNNTAMSFTADGHGYLSDVLYAENGIRYRSANGTRSDRGDFIGEGSPIGVVAAAPGSTYRNVNGGSMTTFWVKTGGTDANGWVAVA